jgi:hypothetical protein
MNGVFQSPYTGGPQQFTSLPAVQEFTVYETKAVPPVNVALAIRGGATGEDPLQGEITWNAPKMKQDLIRGYEVQVANINGGSWNTLKNNGLTASFSPEAIGIAAGQSVQARVRTVLKTGEKSPFAVSNIVVAGAGLLPPENVSVFDAGRALAIYAEAPPGVNTSFPENGFQVRWASDSHDWEFASFAGGFNGTQPVGIYSYVAPFGERAVFTAFGGPAIPQTNFPFGEAVVFEIRTYSQGQLPSEWRHFGTYAW